MNGRYSLNLPIDLKQNAERIARQQGVSLNQLILWSLAEKVASLQSKLDDPDFPNIRYRRDSENQPVPVLRGTNLRVQTIVIAAQYWNEPTAQIAQQYDLSERLIKEALAFYSAHKDMVDALIQSNDKAQPPDDSTQIAS